MLLPFSRPKAIVTNEWWLYVRMIYDDPAAFDLLRMQHAGFPSCLRFSTAGIRARGINSSIKLMYSGRSATRNRSSERERTDIAEESSAYALARRVHRLPAILLRR